MNSLDINRIKRHAHQMRAEEMARLQRLLATRLGASLGLANLAHLANHALHWLFSWHPNTRHS